MRMWCETLAALRPFIPAAYLVSAVIASATYGLGCFKIHGEFKPAAIGWPRKHQYFFNATGAAVGWLAGWVVLVRWLSCSGFVCQGEPTGWTILLAVLAFVGVTGHLPLVLMQSIAALRELLKKIWDLTAG